MMETCELALSPELQALIEMRLDLVERVLIDARLSRGERGSILQELEGQIVQLVERRTDQPSRDDVLAVLADLDPPEAYLADGEEWLRESHRVARMPSGATIERPSTVEQTALRSPLALWAGVLVAGTALTTALLMSAAIWFAPELVLGLVAVIQVAALTGAGLGVAWLLQSKFRLVSGLERAVATSAAVTAPLTLLFLLVMAGVFYLEIEEGIYVLAGFVGGAWIHGAWTGVITCLLWIHGLRRDSSLHGQTGA